MPHPTHTDKEKTNLTEPSFNCNSQPSTQAASIQPAPDPRLPSISLLPPQASATSSLHYRESLTSFFDPPPAEWSSSMLHKAAASFLQPSIASNRQIVFLCSSMPQTPLRSRQPLTVPNPIKAVHFHHRNLFGPSFGCPLALKPP
ncbi:hypothetical protein KC19_VG231200 [Ceratodon purpureus]|uniref:Uncharacterized protein n=1 Tax=Ceratodon purpureus TaxID=3225 RepID=A0A8T0HTJ8_CERPU|nr:hypothetical protein KC19_VG231200 [Ceratodon purpureus]